MSQSCCIFGIRIVVNEKYQTKNRIVSFNRHNQKWLWVSTGMGERNKQIMDRDWSHRVAHIVVVQCCTVLYCSRVSQFHEILFTINACCVKKINTLLTVFLFFTLHSLFFIQIMVLSNTVQLNPFSTLAWAIIVDDCSN
jgi:hypothetical protein